MGTVVGDVGNRVGKAIGGVVVGEVVGARLEYGNEALLVHIPPLPIPAARYCPVELDVMENQPALGADVCTHVPP